MSKKCNEDFINARVQLLEIINKHLQVPDGLEEAESSALHKKHTELYEKIKQRIEEMVTCYGEMYTSFTKAAGDIKTVEEKDAANLQRLTERIQRNDKAIAELGSCLKPTKT